MNDNKNKPPIIAEWLLTRLTYYNYKFYCIGDFRENYNRIYKEESPRAAWMWYWQQVMRSIPSYLSNTITQGTSMLKNYVKIAIRNLLRHRGYSAINIFGLSIGIACSVLIALFVMDDLSFDDYHDNANQIFRVAARGQIGNTKIAQVWTPALLPRTLIKEYPEIIQAISVNKSGPVPVTYNESVIFEKRVFFADSSFFNVFTFPFKKGNPTTALSEPNTVVLTETTANKYFNHEDPMDKTITIGTRDFKITGIVSDVPVNSHFHFDMVYSIISNSNFQSTQWFNNNFKTYIQLQKEYDFKQLEAKFPDFVLRNLYAGTPPTEGNYWEFFLQPLTDIHLTSDISGEFEPNSNKTYVLMFSFISIFVLLIACVNFMNLTTAKAAGRAKEIGIRKVVGSFKIQLIKQFLTESIVLSFVSTVTALLLIELILPVYNNFIGRNLSVPYGDPLVLPGLAVLVLIVGFLSGIYPSFFLSSFKPVTVLKGNSGIGSSRSLLRNGLVVFQFTISIFLIIGTLVVQKQLDLLQNNKLGFDKEQVLVIKNARSLGNNRNSFKNELLNQSFVSSVSIAYRLPGESHDNWGMRPEGMNETTLNITETDEDYLQTLKLEMVDGRFFLEDFPSDSVAIILNETAVKLFGWDDPIGKYIDVFGNTNIRRKVIGVVKDYHYESKRQNIRPMSILNINGTLTSPNYAVVRIDLENLNQNISRIEEIWNTASSNLPFEFSFLDEDYNSIYNNEKQTGTIFAIFSLLTILVASLGLFGLASFMADQRTKEIGIRKVLGASEASIIALFSKDFLKWTFIAVVIATPAGWIFMNNWLQNFAYKIDLSPQIFLTAGALALLTAVITVSYQSVKAAYTHPADSLRNE